MKLLKASILASLLVGWAATSNAQQDQQELELRLEAPEKLHAVKEQIKQFDKSRFTEIVQLLGITDLGDPIRVVLVPEDSRIARNTPSWVAAFADAPNDLIVLFPSRIGSYPYDSLEAVLRHEVTHILASRAAGDNRLPRWFSEGLASTVERPWGIAIRSRFIWASITSDAPTISDIEGLFTDDANRAARGYTISHALVRNLLARYGPSLVPTLLASVKSGNTFDQAFFSTTGTTISRATLMFWHSSGGWEEWVTFLASPYTLWTLITSLALVAIWQHRRRRIKRHRQWEEAERLEAEIWEEHRQKYRLH
ncbi:MAG: peptidase MA family metallohydrolase [Vicinamibacterales bacterium]